MKRENWFGGLAVFSLLVFGGCAEVPRVENPLNPEKAIAQKESSYLVEPVREEKFVPSLKAEDGWRLERVSEMLFGPLELEKNSEYRSWGMKVELKAPVWLYRRVSNVNENSEESRFHTVMVLKSPGESVWKEAFAMLCVQDDPVQPGKTLERWVLRVENKWFWAADYGQQELRLYDGEWEEDGTLKLTFLLKSISGTKSGFKRETYQVR